ncbi:MAG: hypothetical protein HZA22_08730 [Nitrospirae bacterium]|nr:hypothetical protein [Nitrospirota bacterium]
MRGGKSVVLVLAVGLMVSVLATGCAGRQNTIMFGTNTLIGVKVTARDTATEMPEVKIGYERAEFVWMPLISSNKEGDPVGTVCESCPDSCTYCKDRTGACTCPKKMIDGKFFAGKDGNDKLDSYSVIATMSGSLSTGASGTNGGIAQYFATGIAARELAKKSGAALVSTAPSAELEKAKLDTMKFMEETEQAKKSDAEEPKAEEPKAEEPKADEPKADEPKAGGGK